jgi:HSP20 family molecular chaperone IbpA
MSNTLTKTETGAVTRPENTYQAAYVPRFDIWETAEELLLFGDLPGVTPENLDIRFENNELTVHGKVSPRQENIEFLYGEYGIGDFHRTFTVGEAVDAEKISAEMRNGVLTLHLPKSEKVKPRRIEVRTG